MGALTYAWSVFTGAAWATELPELPEELLDGAQPFQTLSQSRPRQALEGGPVPTHSAMPAAALRGAA